MYLTFELKNGYHNGRLKYDLGGGLYEVHKMWL